MNQTAIAWRQAWAGIRVRPARHAMTFFGVALGVAFYAAILSYRNGAAVSVRDGAAIERMGLMAWLALAMMIAGVANSLAISVAERVQEIGTLKCLGASDRLVVAIFLWEATTIGAAGSLVGAFMGWNAGSALVGVGTPSSLAIQCAAVGLATSWAAAILPAIQAARLPAASALRSEI